MFSWEVCPVCFDEFKDPIILSCSHKVCRKCMKSLMPPRNLLRGSLEEAINTANSFVDLERFEITCPYRCSVTSGTVGSPPPHFDLRLSSESVNDTALAKSVVCFLIDGSEKYMEMTIRAINSLMYSTPIVSIGILIPPNYDAMDLYSRFLDPTRVMFKEFKYHFENWNPTQFKLDTLQFAQDFSCVFWLDSDTIVYKDISKIIAEFCFSSAKVAFLKDHVCSNEEFLQNWRNKVSPFIPQACFMGFKSDFMQPFFTLWEEIWRQWIEPGPFVNFPDPLPSFSASSFCIEQYALGMAIEASRMSTTKDIYELRRICIPLNETIFSSNLQKSLLKQIVDKFWNYLHFNSSAGLSLLTSFSGISSGSAFWVDDIEEHIIHFYSLNYEVAFGWWSNYSEEIILKIKQLWDLKNNNQNWEQSYFPFLIS